jgi:ribonuclease PH
LRLLGERTCIVDCDVLQADGGTRTAAITGGYLALALALRRRILEGELPPALLLRPVAAISVGILSGQPILDLSYAEDSKADVDMNVVMDGKGNYIEIQGTAEGKPFTPQTLNQLLELAKKGIDDLISIQRTFIEANT